MENLEFLDVNEFDKYYSKKLLNSSSVESTNYRNDDNYKNLLGGELIQQFFKIKKSRAVIGTWKNHRGYKWWIYGELLSELLDLNPPIMYKYKPDLLSQHYTLLDDGRMQYTYSGRFVEFNQLVNIYNKLKENPNSKRCVVDIFTPYDSSPERTDCPCTAMYQFIQRDGRLNMSVFMRSWDFFGGAKTYDFALSSFVLQSLCSWLNFEPGELGIYANSLHYYNRDRENLEKLVYECKTNNLESDDLVLSEKRDITSFYDELRKVKLAEEAAYNQNFDKARIIRDSLNVSLFKDMCDVWIEKNAKTKN